MKKVFVNCFFSFKKKQLSVIAMTILTTVFSAHATSNEAGRETFDAVCSSCHNGGFRGFMTGAPKIGKDSAWEGRIANGIPQAVEDVVAGTDDHPSMKSEEGLSKEEVNAALLYIIQQTSILNEK